MLEFILGQQLPTGIFFLCSFFAFELVSFVKCTKGWWWRGVGLLWLSCIKSNTKSGTVRTTQAAVEMWEELKAVFSFFCCSWKWRMKIQLMCSSSKQEEFTKTNTQKRTCYFPLQNCAPTGDTSQLEKWDLVQPHPDYCSIVFSLLSDFFFLFLLLYIK